MRWVGVLIVILALFLLPIANPSTFSTPAAIVDEAQETMFSTAADGSESDQSIELFAETIPDDTLFFPDAFLNDTIVQASSGTAGTESETGTYANTHTKDAIPYSGHMTTTPRIVYVTLNFTIPTGLQVEGFNYAMYSYFYNVAGDSYVYDWTNDVWVDIGNVGTSYSWDNGTLYNPDYWDTQVSLRIYKDAGASPCGAYIDYAEVTFYEMHLADSDHFGESFADVSDWTASVGNTPGSDGDKLEWSVPGDNAYDKIYSNSPSITNIENYYYEFTAWANITAGAVRFQLYGYPADGAAANSYLIADIVDLLGSAQTYKGIITQDSACESIAILSKSTTTDVEVYSDYLRIGNSTSMGWQHDGSTTAGVTDGGGGSSSSDGDELTLTADSDGSTFEFAIDTTATAAYLDADYYPMINLDFNDADSADYVKVESYDGAAWATVLANTTVGTDTLYANCRAADADIEKFRISVNPSANPRLNWFKAFSIANWTYSSSGVGTDDYLYVDSGVLHSNIDDGYIELNHDTALSVSNTYSVYNLTTSGTAPEFSQYVSEWSSYSDDTRGATTSGTVTDIKLKFDSTETLSAIKFIEDSTAPAVVRSNVAPLTPDSVSTITLSAVVTDAVEVYKVHFDAIVYPDGFDDIAYYATEQSDNFWSHTFTSTLDIGYYCFKVVATDGANENTMTSDSYIDFTVEARSQTIYIRIFDSLGDFVPFETFEVYRNGTRQYTDTFEGNTEYAYQIQVKDRWGESLNTTTFAAGDQELVVTVEVYSLKVMSWHFDFVRFNVTRAGLTYSEIVTPLEVINFRLYTNTYDWAIDYLNGTSTSGDITLTNSTALIVTGNTISDVLGLVNTVNTMTNAINITTTTISNEVVTIQLMFDWSNTTLYNQSINIIAAFNWENTTLYNQTISIASLFNATNTVLYDQIILIQNMFDWENTTLFNQTISILNAFNATNTVIYEQTVSILSEISSMP
jgi:hypothetical protein